VNDLNGEQSEAECRLIGGGSVSRGEMMREATLSLLDAATTDDDAHPRVWAPFIVVVN